VALRRFAKFEEDWMRVLVAGASGVVGRALIPALVGRGHHVGALARSSASHSVVSALRAEPLAADALDPESISSAFQRFKPEAVVHQLTALRGMTDLRHFETVFAQTNLLRTKGTDILLAAAREVGARRFVAQSYCGWPYARVGGPVKTENDPLDSHPPAALRSTLEALQYLEAAVEKARDVGGISLRYGGLYGPFLAEPGGMIDLVRRRRFPVVGMGGGIWSFIHINDVASATIAAVENDALGTFNVVDDDPAPVAQWLPALAAAVGAKPPLRIPAVLGRLVLPKHLFVMMTDVRGGSNTKFKRAFDWQPTFSSWRDGFRRGLH
jgi:nucleoside-diphosphate-sugar epimerase